MKEHNSTVLLYYYFVKIDDPEHLASQQRFLCQKHGLKGRILIANEGINGTIAGSVEGIQAYQTAMRSDSRFESMEFKISHHERMPFPKLMVKIRPEIVTLGANMPLDTAQEGGTHLSPAEWKRMIEEDKDVVLFDTRNRYESDIGKFKDAICPNTENFRDLPDALSNYEQYKNKKFLMYCTGGIRCEKATVLFKKAGFKNVFQLHGGIVNYWKEEGHSHWEGDCFVFDERMYLKPPGTVEEVTSIGRCVHSNQPTSHFINCLHDQCHKLILVHPDLIEEDSLNQICPTCREKGLNLETAIYPGSPAQQAKKTPKTRKNRLSRKRSINNEPNPNPETSQSH